MKTVLGAVRRRPGSVVAAASTVGIATGLTFTTTAALAHGSHPHTHDGNPHNSGVAARLLQLEQQVTDLADLLSAYTSDVNLTTGQGKAIFSWDRGLTACFPADARPFEKNLHGGFNEDPKTGIV